MPKKTSKSLPSHHDFWKIPFVIVPFIFMVVTLYKIHNSPLNILYDYPNYNILSQIDVPSKRLVSHVLDTSGFSLGRSPTQFITQTSFATKEENGEYLYQDKDLRMILRAMTTMRSFTNQGLWSGSEGPIHFLGTGSCLIKLEQPAVDVAVGVMHSIYLQKWRDHALVEKEDTCDLRYRMQSVIGSTAEQALWLGTGLFGNGPWNSCLSTYSIALDKQKDGEENSKLSLFLNDLPLSMLLCDEIEEAIGGEAILSGHWKKRDVSHFDLLQKLASKINLGEPLLTWIDQARQMSHAIHHPNPLKQYKELTPNCVADLLQTKDFEDFHPHLSSSDKTRFHAMISMTLADRYMLPRYNGNYAQSELLSAIRWSRVACDKVAAHNISLDSYLAEYFDQKEKLLKCERTDPRFMNTTIPVPLNPPPWAIPQPRWSSHLHYP